MPRRTRTLYALQRIDTQLALKRRRYRQVESQLGESPALIEARAELKVAQEEQARWRAALLDRELQTASVSDKLQSDEERLYSGRVKEPRELSDLQKETEYLKRRKADLEDKQLEAMLTVEETTTRLAVAQEKFVVVESGWKAENAEFHQEYETLKHELAHLLAQRKTVVKHLSDEDLAEYDSIRRLRKGRAVAAVRDDMCSVCNVRIPDRDLEKAEQTDDLFYCSGCDRILYVPQD